MVAGQVLPPGCFLDAPEMLRRQLVAFAMDAWARQETEVKVMPNRAAFVLGNGDPKKFPGCFVEFYRKNHQELSRAFISLFKDYLSDVNRQRIEEFAETDAVPRLVIDAFQKLKTELDELRAIQDRVRRRRRDVDTNPDAFDDPELEKRELEETVKVLGRLRQELRTKYPLNVLTDEGVLPNYAFPEPGVRLESVIRQKNDQGQWEYEGREYVRPASSAIRELAPFNTFYADGRRVKIDEIDIGSRARPLHETWRLCRECSHMERELEDKPPEASCPRCGDLNWSDAGQARTLVHFRRSRSLASGLEISTVDDTEDRHEAYYELLDLIDVAPEHWSGAKLIDSLPFGYELLKNLTLREINFGLNGHGHRNVLRVRGAPVSETGFEVCIECGRVRDERGEIQHAAQCRARKSGVQETVSSLYLYREVRSEAIRILLPVSEVGLDEKRASFKAALQLAFRRHFQGDPGHLLIKSVREPVAGGHASRQYLVIYDGVPGGTGYLSELWHGHNFLTVLEQALQALQSCICQTTPGRDGCYGCLYGYQSQRELPLISSRLAQEILRSILQRSEELREVRTLSEVSLDSKVESELEAKFLAALEERAKETRGLSWAEKVKGGEVRWILRTERQDWEIRTQVNLGAVDGVYPGCRPDFLFRPANADPAVKPVAVFCDGFAYHVCPGEERGRLADDIEKRQGVIESGNYLAWSVTWKDVGDFEAGGKGVFKPALLGSVNSSRLGKTAKALELALDKSLGKLGSMEMLLAYLGNPTLHQWERLARSYALTWLTEGPLISPSAGIVLQERMQTEPDRFEPDPAAIVGPDAETLFKQATTSRILALGRCAQQALRAARTEELEITLRLFDEESARSSQDFEQDWRTFLQAWNLLQFHGRVMVLSSETIATGYTPRPVEPALVEEGSTPEGDYGRALQGILDLATAASRPLIEAIAAENLPLPTLDFELETDGLGIGPEPELSWPQLRIAVLADRQLEDVAAFEQAGWRVFTHPVVSEELLTAVRSATSAGQS